MRVLISRLGMFCIALLIVAGAGPVLGTLANVDVASAVAPQSEVRPVSDRLAVRLAAGQAHTCALSGDGRVMCWGHNNQGQLGLGTSVDWTSPAQVTISGVVALAAGDEHTCALTAAGAVKCWGRNDYGQLGDGSTTGSETPVSVSGLTVSVSALVAGGHHTCVRTTTGGVKCWGSQVGIGATTGELTPKDIVGLTAGVSKLASGREHVCALMDSGTVKCFGVNDNYQCGVWGGDQATPVEVTGPLANVADIVAGQDHTCVLSTGGGVQCWGRGLEGQLGDYSIGGRPGSADVYGLTSGVLALGAGWDHTCAALQAGGVQCWGSNEFGQIGNGSDDASLDHPVSVSGPPLTVTALAGGGYHMCAVTGSGAVYCWGRNQYGQAGDGTGGYPRSPVGVKGMSAGAASLSGGEKHTCGIDGSGAARCWGLNDYGQVGDGTTTDREAPVVVPGLTSGVRVVAAGMTHSCAVTTAGAAWCWGENLSGELGDGTKNDSHAPVAVSGLSANAEDICLGQFHTCALTSGGGVKCWGWNIHGELGDSTTSEHTTPVDVVGLTSGVKALACGGIHTCALTTAGGVKCWGDNSLGQLGDGNGGSSAHSSTAVDVSGLSSGVTTIGAGYMHTCAVTAGGGAVCWGSAYDGELGNGSQLGIAKTPVQVTGLTSGVSDIAAAMGHTCAVAGGSLWCWGHNADGEIGDGSTTNAWVPVQVSGATSGASRVAAGFHHSCAVLTGGRAVCWGSNEYGQIGNGGAKTGHPVAVLAFGAADTYLYLPVTQH